MSSLTSTARLGRRISVVLRVGTLVAVAIVTVGFGLAILAGGEGRAAPIVDVIANGGPDALIMVGLLGLTLLPFGVLAVAAATFGSDGERRYLVSSVITLVLLVASLATAALVAGAS